MKDWLKDNERYIKMFFPAFSLKLYCVLLALVVFLLLFAYSKTGFIGSMTFGVVGFALGVFAFDSAALHCKNKIKRMFLEFISLLSSNSTTSANIIEALKATAEDVEEPLKGILNKSLYLYDKGQLTQYEMFTKLSEEIGDDEFEKLFLILATTEDTGGNYVEILNRMRECASKTYEVDAQLRGTAKGGVVVIFLMIVLNLYSINTAIKSNETSVFLLGTNYGNILMITNLLFIIISLLIARWMML